MCIIGTAIQVHQSFPFILAANRDEFIQRPAAPAHWWEEGFVAGKDLSQGGTWLGLSQNGKIGALTNVRDPWEADAEYSRGIIIPKWLKHEDLSAVLKEQHKYGGFNLLYGSVTDLHYLTNRQGGKRKLDKGIYALSNADLSTEWPKTKQLKIDIENSMKSPKEKLIEELFESLQRRDLWPDKFLPDTGVGRDIERKLSPAYIDMEEYGTRCSTVILVDYQGEASFIERSFRPEKTEVSFHFQLRL